jgi:predicted neuraminidase
MRRVFSCLFAVLAGVAALGAASGPAVVVDEFIYEKAPYPSCHASTIVETDAHEYVAAWFGGTAERNPDVGIWVSRFDPATKAWSPGVEVANGVQPDGTRVPTWNPVLFQPRAGAALQLYYKVGPTPQTWWGMVRTSRDGGRTWSDARRLPDGILGPIKNKPVQLDDGTILAGSSAEVPKPLTAADAMSAFTAMAAGVALTVVVTLLYCRFLRERKVGGWLLALAVWIVGLAPFMWVVNKLIFQRPSEWRVHFESSSDGGETWAATMAANDGLKLAAIQPSLLFRGPMGGGRLQAVGRTRQRKVFTIDSNDGGKTWGKMSLLKVPNPNAGTDAVTLQDGRHLLVCNPVAKGRTPLVVDLSRNGREWTQVVVLEDQPGEYSYPAVIQASDGLVHITYTWKRQRVKHVVLDPAKL